MTKSADAIWEGSGRLGIGKITMHSHGEIPIHYSFNSRFADGQGSSPEELLAAAHASCYAMKLSFILNEAGYLPEDLMITCHITMDRGSISASHLIIKACIAGLSEDQFLLCITEATATGPMSRALNIHISTEAILTQKK